MSGKTTRSGRTVRPLKRMIADDEDEPSNSKMSPPKKPLVETKKNTKPSVKQDSIEHKNGPVPKTKKVDAKSNKVNDLPKKMEEKKDVVDTKANEVKRSARTRKPVPRHDGANKESEPKSRVKKDASKKQAETKKISKDDSNPKKTALEAAPVKIRQTRAAAKAKAPANLNSQEEKLGQLEKSTGKVNKVVVEKKGKAKNLKQKGVGKETETSFGEVAVKVDVQEDNKSEKKGKNVCVKDLLEKNNIKETLQKTRAAKKTEKSASSSESTRNTRTTRPKRSAKEMVENDHRKEENHCKKTKIESKQKSPVKNLQIMSNEKEKEQDESNALQNNAKPETGQKTEKKSEKIPKRALKKDQIAQLLNEDDDESSDDEIQASPVKEEVAPVKKNSLNSKAKTEKNKKVVKAIIEKDPQEAADDTEVSFNVSKLQKKKPIYMRRFSPQKKQKTEDKNFDIYDELSSDDEETKQRKLNKKKKAPTKRKPRKKKPQMILAFDKNKTQITEAMKRVRNLQTPMALKKTETRTHPQGPPKIVLSSPKRTAKAILPKPSSSSTFSEKPAEPIQNEFVNEDDDINFVDDIPDNIPEQVPMDSQTSYVPEPPRQHVKSYKTPMIPKHIGQLGQNRQVSTPSENEEVFEKNSQNGKLYKTPMVPKHMTKMGPDRKASTPRLEDSTTKRPHVPKATMMKNCFGFDDSSADSDANNVSQESLIGFSPVQKVQSTENDRLIVTPMTSLRDKPKILPSVVKPLAPPSSICKPMRFQFKMPRVRVTSTDKAIKYKKVLKKAENSQNESKKNPLKPMVLSTTPDSDSNWETTLFDDLPEREIGIATETEVKNLEETEMNAFEMMNKKGKGGKKANVTKKPLKTVTNTASKVKQSLITDHTSGLPKKIRAKAR